VAAPLLAGLSAHLPDRLVQVEPGKALQPGGPAPDVIVVTEPPRAPGSGLALLPQLRADRARRHCGLVYIARPHAPAEAASALDMGASAVLTEAPHPEELALRLRRLIRRKRAGDRLRAEMQSGLRAALIDPLTGLYNRRYAVPHLARLAEQAAAARRPLAVLLADIDRFKRVNDRHGHGAGDAVLQHLAQVLRAGLQPPDLLARWGGEEFLLALPGCSGAEALARAEALRAGVAARPVPLPGGAAVTVTLSLGLALPPPGAPVQPRELLDRADRALYAAKAAGRDRVVLAEGLRARPAPRPLAEPPAPPRALGLGAGHGPRGKL
jgi:two-component system cell cycle response regulator